MRIIDVTDNARFVSVKLGQIKPNRFRDLDRWPVERDVIEGLKRSINETGFWSNLQAVRNENDDIELRFGHHRWTAGLELFGPDYEIAVELVSFSGEWELLRALHMENSIGRNKVTHTHEVVSQLVHWWDDVVFEKYPTWDEISRSGFLTRPTLESYFGPSKAESDDRAPGTAAYAKCVKYGIGRGVIEKMLDGSESTETVKQTLANLPLTERRKRGLELAAEEQRKEAEAKRAAAEKIRQEREAEAAKRAEQERKEHEAAERIRQEMAEARKQKNKEIMQKAMREAEEKDKRLKAEKARREADLRQARLEAQRQAEKERELEEQARKAEERAQQKASTIENREWFDPKAAEVFDRHAHGAAFRMAVMEPSIRSYLTTDSLEPFARAVRDELQALSDKTGREYLTADNIRKAVRENFKTFHNGIKFQQKQEQEQAEKNNPLIALKRKMDEAGAALKVAKAKVSSFRAEKEAQKVTSISMDYEFDKYAKEVIEELAKLGYVTQPKVIAK